MIFADHHYFRYLVLELCKASLDQVFLPDDDPQKYRGPRLPHHSEVLLQLAKGLAYIHSQHFIHGDIKPSNVLISVDHSPNVTMKWSDFSKSKPVDKRGEYEIETEGIVGTFSISGLSGVMNWMAPELLDVDCRSINEIKRGTVKSDVFAEGLLFAYYLGGGVHPYGDPSREIPAKIMKNKTPIIPTSELYCI